jgi:hypothetical protein
MEVPGKVFCVGSANENAQVKEIKLAIFLDF